MWVPANDVEKLAGAIASLPECNLEGELGKISTIGS
jgi:hypothetical protein